MKLTITTPAEILVETEGVVSVRAADASGWFGIRDGHADFLTVLDPSVMSWKNGDGTQHFAALQGGVLSVRGGAHVAVATREAFVGDDLDRLAAGEKVSLLASLASRNDAAAHTAIADQLLAPDAAVRQAAIGALANLGTPPSCRS